MIPSLLEIINTCVMWLLLGWNSFTGELLYTSFITFLIICITQFSFNPMHLMYHVLARRSITCQIICDTKFVRNYQHLCHVAVVILKLIYWWASLHFIHYISHRPYLFSFNHMHYVSCDSCHSKKIIYMLDQSDTKFVRNNSTFQFDNELYVTRNWGSNTS